MNVFVTDGNQRPALAITRSLGRRGVSVIVGEETPHSLSSCSRYATRHVTYPSPRECPHAFDQFLFDFVEREQIDAVLPVTDVTMHAASRNGDRLRLRTGLAVPSLEAFESVTEKSTLVRLASSCGIAVPHSKLVNGISDVRAIAGELDFPVVIKPSRSRMRTDTGWIPTSVHYAACANELFRLYREVEYLASAPALVQQRIVGPGEGVFVLFDKGQLVTVFAHRRLREKPPSGGTSVLSESIPVEKALEDAAVRLLSPLAWHGVAMLEYKRDAARGDMYLMEVNGRFWGSLQLAVDAGVDFPHLTYQLATGRPPDAPASYRVGAKSRWFLGDVDHLLLRLRQRDAALHLPPGSPSRCRAVVDFMKVGERRLRYDVFDAADRSPQMYEASQYLRDIMPMNTRVSSRTGLLRFSWDLATAFVVMAVRRCVVATEQWMAAWQMMRIRRNPKSLLRALRSARTVLVVCHGNIIRSPFAARLVAHAAAGARRVTVKSGGLAAVSGKPSHPSAVATATKLHVDLSDHHAEPLDRRLVQASDVIFVMELRHVVEMRRRFPESASKTFLLTCLAAETPLEIEDPYNGDLSHFEACFDHITRAVRPIARTLSSSAA